MNCLLELVDFVLHMPTSVSGNRWVFHFQHACCRGRGSVHWYLPLFHRSIIISRFYRWCAPSLQSLVLDRVRKALLEGLQGVLLGVGRPDHG
jgi:hypothetical protein